MASKNQRTDQNQMFDVQVSRQEIEETVAMQFELLLDR